MRESAIHRITLYTRPGCHLCEEASELLDRLAAQIALEVTEVNILDDVGLFERYRYSIPIIVIAGGPTLSAPIREGDLRHALEV